MCITDQNAKSSCIKHYFPVDQQSSPKSTSVYKHADLSYLSALICRTFNGLSTGQHNTHENQLNKSEYADKW